MRINAPGQVPILILGRHNRNEWWTYLVECDAWIASAALSQVGCMMDIAESWEYIADNYLYFDYQFGFKFSKTSKHRLIPKWK